MNLYDIKRVSVIIPIYNADKYLERCIESVVMQTYKNLEIVLINDGSIDRSDEICRKWQKQDERICYYVQDNRGVSAARNAGMRKAKGHYVTFVDADDWLASDCLEYLVGLLERNVADMVACACWCVEKEILLEDDSEELITVMSQTEAECNLAKEGTAFVWGRLYLSESLKNIWFDEELPYGEDTLFVHSVISNCEKVVGSNCKKYYYFQHPESACHKEYTMKRLTDLIHKQKCIQNCIYDENLYIHQLGYIKRIIHMAINTVRFAKSEKWMMLKQLKKELQNSKRMVKSINMEIKSHNEKWTDFIEGKIVLRGIALKFSCLLFCLIENIIYILVNKRK